MKKPLRVAVMSNGPQYGKLHRQCMNLIMQTVHEGKSTIQVEYVDCQRIRNLETFVSKWLNFEEDCIKKDGPYASNKIPNMMEEARSLLGLGIVVIDSHETSAKESE